MKLVASDNGVKEVQIAEGPIARRQKDGTFNVPDDVGKWLRTSGDFAVAGLNFQGVHGHFCPECGRENVFRDSCGRCGWQDVS